MTSDFIVVGSGSAGAVLASRLSEDPSARVLLLEAGSGKIPRESIVPAAFSKLFKTPFDWNYSTAPEPGLERRSLYWPRGRLLGGSSAMNAMIWTPPDRADLDQWTALGNQGWSFEDLRSSLARSERPGEAARARGEVGIDVNPLRTVNPITESLIAAARTAGIPPNDGFRDGSMAGTGTFRVTQRRGRRVSTADGYLAPVRDRSNLTVVPLARVHRVLFSGRRATGVEYRTPDSSGPVRAFGPVVLAAGAIGSPQLLLLSGVGPARELATLGIEVVADLPGVGKNLQDHLACGAIYSSARPVTLAGAQTVANFLRYLAFGRGPLTSNVAEAGAFVRLGPGAGPPDVELIFAPSFFVDHGFGNPEGHGFTVAAILLHPESRGTITLSSADPAAPPIIQANYLATELDRTLIRQGLELARSIAGRAEVAAFRDNELLPGPEPDLDHFIRSHAETLYHPVGTCRMGPDGGSVVTDRLTVHGLEDLWVVDGSVMPQITSGHTHAPIVMIAERAADILARGTGGGR